MSHHSVENENLTLPKVILREINLIGVNVAFTNFLPKNVRVQIYVKETKILI